MKKSDLILSYMVIGGSVGFLGVLPVSMVLGYQGNSLQPWIMGGIIAGAAFGVYASFRLGSGLPGAKLLQREIGRYGLWGSFVGTVVGGILAVLLQFSFLSWILAILGLNGGLMLGQRIEALHEKTLKRV